MAPKRVGPFDNSIHKILTNGLETRYDVLPSVAKRFLLNDVEQWDKLRRLEGGDIMHAHSIVSKRLDGRDASFIRVRDLIVGCFIEIIDFYLLPNSMSNSLVETSAIQTVLKCSDHESSSGNSCT